MLLDEYLPIYDVHARYGTNLPAPPALAYRTARDLDWSQSSLVSWLLRLRGLGWLKAESTVESMQRAGFMILGEEPGRELVLGAVGRFWLPSAGVRRISPREFRDFAIPGNAKAAFNLLAVAEGGGTLLSTETRVQCLGPQARRYFRLYWSLIGPFSGLIRKEALRLVRKQL